MELNIIIYAVAAFLVVTLVLVALLLFAKAKLTSSGAVKIDINEGGKVLEVESGSTLLNTLSEQGIFLPSACGGKGACGQCKCQVVAGGGEILPTERGFFNRREISEGWRLGCQVKVKEDMQIKVPASV
ncbi:MAG: 2Fe-2S iron-sulfur cluster binding domain-containing protein, partial [Alistipes sp.]|nr:2Fe-2S iron-sulfur cluster binding domain-containing protein [Alistipes sp.]